MNKYLLLFGLLLFTVFSCEQTEIQTRPLEETSCVRVRNDSGSDLQDVRIRLASDGTLIPLGNLNNEAVSEYTSISGADWCNYLLEARDEAGGVYKSGDWICEVATPLGNGQFTVVLTLSPSVPAEATILEAELVED